MTAREKVRRMFPGAKCIRRINIYLVLEWDAFFAVGPLLGCGYSANEAWTNAERFAR